MRLVAFVGIAGLLVGGIVGCGGGDSSSSSSASSSSGPSAPPPPPGAPSAPSSAPASATSSSSPDAATSMVPMGASGYGASAYSGYPESGTSTDMTPMRTSAEMYGGDGYDPGYNAEATSAETYGADAYAPPGYGPSGYGPNGYGASGQAQAMLKPKSLREQAVDALRAGRETEGHRLLLTHFAASSSGGEELSEKMAWFGGLRRPALGPRLGVVAVYVNPPRDFKGSPMPIGSKEAESAVATMAKAGGNRRGSGGGSGDDGGRMAEMMGSGGEMGYGYDQQQGPGEALKDFEYHTGEFGTKMLEAVKERIAAGQYGEVYRDLAAEIEKAGKNPNSGYPGGSGGGSDSADYAAMMAAQGGGVLSPPGRPGGPGAEGGDEKKIEEARQLSLGVAWLGKVESKEELKQAAMDAGVDVVLAYEIQVSPARGSNFVRNSTRLRISTAAKDEQIFVSPKLENLKVLMDRQKGVKAEDPVEKEIGRALEALDGLCKSAPLPPAVTGEVVKRRIAALVAEDPADPLPALVETRFYVSKGLLPEEEFLTAGVTLMGQAEFAELLMKDPNGGMGQMLGSALSLPGMLSAVRGVNAAAKVVPGAAKEEKSPQQKQGGGLSGLLPFKLPFGGASGQPPGQPTGSPSYPPQGSPYPPQGTPSYPPPGTP